MKANDDPLSGALLDYGNTVGPLTPPQSPPHNLSYPTHGARITPAWTNDKRPGIAWDGVHAEQATFISPGGALDDLPQGDAWTFLVAAMAPLGSGAQTVFTICAGSGLDNDGKALFCFQTGSFGNGTGVCQVDYNGGAEAHHQTNDARFTDGNWHLYCINVYPVGGNPNPLASTMQYDLYIDGALVDSFTLNSNGISVFYANGNFSSKPDAFRIGGYPAWAGVPNRSKGAIQHFAIFLGSYAQFGPMLTSAQIAAVNASR